MPLSPRVAAAIALASVLLRFVLAARGWGEILHARPELSSAVDAATRLREGDALRRLGQSPYAGSALHAPPLLLAALAPRIASAPTIGTRAVAPFVVFDVLAAFALFFASRRIEARRIVWSRAGSAGGPDASAAAKREASRRVASTPWTVAALSLANPLAIASCVACSCAGLRTAALAFLIFGASCGNPHVAGFGLATSAYLGGIAPLAMLFAPTASAIAKGGAEGHRPGVDGGMRGREIARRSAAEVSGHSPATATAKLFAWTTTWLFALTWLSTDILRGHASFDDWFRACYVYLLVPDDLAPNLGAHWYFFSELFDHFVGFYRFVFAFFPAFLATPLTIRFIDSRPTFAIFGVTCLGCIMHPYPTLGDAARYLSLLPLFSEELAAFHPGAAFAVVAGFFYVILLSPIFWRLWIVDRVANANFFYAVTLTYFAVQSGLFIECARVVLRHDFSTKVALGLDKESLLRAAAAAEGGSDDDDDDDHHHDHAD